MRSERSRQACGPAHQFRPRYNLARCRGPHHTKRKPQEQPVERCGCGECEQRGKSESRDTEQSDHGSLPVVRQGDGIPAANPYLVENRIAIGFSKVKML